ncbi:hypothetical protein [Sphingosinicella microcystinivorans]|uniref:Uncharacterized protein n=1 Tax=Sphingosinicella microcystinivorans TaxID=335406 RepID=A0AAD1D6T6_SPHMI|nr:hypothetical protein [Sphingosinicella microcystinivorans]RKS91451.1 hypothetical protein DFR51_1015 [Sphingosinicella microcystinivorans]BBE34428.1 hypothetical protein SmB9_20860 [Sphingosinicella microcystinivorans]
MAVFVVTWNLNKERSGYDQARREFIAHLERYDNVKDSGLETVRWISTTNTAEDISAFLQQKLDKNDRLFISKLNSGQHQGWLDKTTWSWINARL